MSKLIDREAVLRRVQEFFGGSWNFRGLCEDLCDAIAALPVETAQARESEVYGTGNVYRVPAQATSAEGRAEYEAMQKDWAKRVPKPDLLRAPVWTQEMIDAVNQDADRLMTKMKPLPMAAPVSEERESTIETLRRADLDAMVRALDADEKVATTGNKDHDNIEALIASLLRAPQQQEQSGNLPAPRTDPA